MKPADPAQKGKYSPDKAKNKTPKSAKAAPQAEPAESIMSKFFNFLQDAPAPVKQRIDEKNALHKQKSIERLVTRQSYAIVAIVLIIILMMPILQPVHKYRLYHDGEVVKPLVALNTPNLTDQAVLSWAATTVTEVMTFGFGDVEQSILSQRYRFTEDGWNGFVKAVLGQALPERFKGQQLVLTTAPTDAPVVVAKGKDPKDGYMWIVEMPVIMTYSTNNNATSRSKGIARLTIVRVPTLQNKAGIGIRKWDFH